MVRLVRHGFETNSSSAHSITLGESAVYDSITPNDEGVIVLREYEFGWEWETYTTVEARLAYAYIYARDWSGGYRTHFMDTLETVVRNHTGATAIVMGRTNEWGNYDEYAEEDIGGYIDHQSVENGELDYLFQDPTLLKKFIFNAGSTIETGNDN